MLKEDLRMIRQILRDDEDKIEHHTQILNFCDARNFTTRDPLGWGSFPEGLGKFQNDDIRIESHAQTLNSVTERLSECEAFKQCIRGVPSCRDDWFVKRSFRKTLRNRGTMCIQQQEIVAATYMNKKSNPWRKGLKNKKWQFRRGTRMDCSNIATWKVPVSQPVGQTANVAVRSTLLFNAPKGTNKICACDQQLFRRGQTIIIGQDFVAKIIDYGSLVLFLDQDYPSGTTVRAITPQDAHGVSGHDLQSTIGIPNGQGISDRSVISQIHPVAWLENTGVTYIDTFEWLVATSAPTNKINRTFRVKQTYCEWCRVYPSHVSATGHK